jgi:sugar/nucleoside kinase (ribokinase family)
MESYLKHKKIDVLGIGNAIVDISANVNENFLHTNDFKKGVMKLINEEESRNLNKKIKAVKITPGGSAANTIAALAVMGNKVAFIGKVKNDEFGVLFEKDLKNLGIFFNTPKEKGNDYSSTAVCIVLTTPDAQRTMNTCLGVAGSLDEKDIDEALVSKTGIIYLEGYLWDKENAKKAFLKAINIAHKNHSKTALSLSDPFCVERHRDEFINLIQNKIDILFANEIEILSLFQIPDFNEAVKRCMDFGIIAAITRSEKGSVIISGQKTYKIDAVETTVVDSTGAGDMYAAGFLNGLIKGKNPYICGKMGSILAAEAISHTGARPEVSLGELLKNIGF